MERSIGGTREDVRWTGRLPVRSYRTLILLVVLGAGSTAVRLQAQVPTAELGWVGLFNSALIEWLENENRLAELCKPSEGSTRWEQCKAEKMEPKLLVIAVRASPQSSARAIGTIVVVASPGRGLRAYGATGGVTTAFDPDLYDRDWGYGPYFHQTILNRKGAWFQVPIDALPSPGWVNSAEWTDEADVKAVDGIISMQSGGVVVLGTANRELRVRPEQPPDMWCEPGDPPRLQPWKETRIPFRDLFDRRGHLVVVIKYTRGC